MTFLPIVERELRVAARHQFTYWLRPIAAAVPLAVFTAILVLMMLEQAAGAGSGTGIYEFTVLSWMAFIYAACAGVFLTADTLSEEKREGTLGLLFLTDLRGYDVVFGKLIPHSLRAFYALVAAFPVLALPLLLGGVTGALFWTSLLVICNTLFLSLALGMFISSISREVTKAMALSFLLVLFFVAGLPWLDLALADWDSSKFECLTAVASPGHLFAMVENLSPRDFRVQLGIQHALAWGFLILASLCVPRAWKEKSNTTSGRLRTINARWNFGGKRGRLAFRRRLLQPNPIRWLAARHRGMARLAFVLVALSAAGMGCFAYVHWKTGRFDDVGVVVLLFIPLLVLWIPTRAADFFSEARRHGAMELMLVTGVTPRQIVRGQWTVLWKTFSLPVLFVVGLVIAATVNEAIDVKHNPGMTPAQYREYAFNEMMVCLVFATYAIGTALALAWFGMWMGLSSRKTAFAVLKTVCFVCVAPWLMELFMIFIGEVFVVRFIARSPNASRPIWLAIGFVVFCDLAKNLFFIFLSRWRLLTSMRETVSLSGQPKPRRWRPPSLPNIPAPAPGISNP